MHVECRATGFPGLIVDRARGPASSGAWVEGRVMGCCVLMVSGGSALGFAWVAGRLMGCAQRNVLKCGRVVVSALGVMEGMSSSSLEGPVVYHRQHCQ